MAVTVHARTAAITLVGQNAKPGIDIKSEKVVCHLTNGYRREDSVSRAFQAVGSVRITLGPGDSLSGWQFGFLQFQKTNFAGYFYAGKAPSHGSVSILISEPPAMPQKLALDSNDNYSPWTVPQPRFEHFPPEINAGTGDHPLNRAATKVVNKITDKVNFLFHVVDHREFWSVFTAQNPAGNVQHLAHFRWELRYDFMFAWAGDKPSVFRNGSSFKLGAVASGPPKEAEVSALLAKPSPPQANELMKKAVLRAISGSRPNRADNQHWFANVPVTFFR